MKVQLLDYRSNTTNALTTHDSIYIFRVENFGNETLKHHLDVMKEMINRDKNHPSVVMWSLANEPASSLLEAETYFR